MALPNPLPRVQDSRAESGSGMVSECFLINPGYKDYVSTGYFITTNGYAETAAQMASYPNPAQVPFRIIQSVSVDGFAALSGAASGFTGTAATSFVNGIVVLPIAQLLGTTTQGGGVAQYSGAGVSGYQYFNFRVFNLAGTEATAASTDLSGLIWLITINGY